MRVPLDTVFGVDSNIRVLRVLVTHGGPLSSSDIARRATLSKTGTRQGLISLEECGAIVTEGSGYSRLHRFNRDYYLAPQIEALFAAESVRFETVLDAVRLSAGERTPDLSSLFVYGSVARGEDRLGSDLDIGLVAGKETLAGIVEKVRENLRESSRSLGFTPSVVGLDLDDVSRLDRDRDPWWNSMLADAIVLQGRRPEDIAAQVRERGDG
ncbi:helix-turn-helix domain-containing protein [Rhizobium phaseoli]|jgi:predicted nucleotidyltransferase|uniref:Helix-turn-helix domain-containing protein n=2 Tax=Rhizobium phaseoli TaxID=396 RepID=A0A7K3UEI7_9HYPH|nr:helix-turn-helix domain-containing protein [Rhizobium phaseoli]NEJ71734.1 helix-turn-helix domain-containing protein [Rhizobium phaseoli]